MEGPRIWCGGFVEVADGEENARAVDSQCVGSGGLVGSEDAARPTLRAAPLICAGIRRNRVEPPIRAGRQAWAALRGRRDVLVWWRGGPRSTRLAWAAAQRSRGDAVRARSGQARAGRNNQRPSRGLPTDPWEKGPERGIWVSPCSRDPSRDSAGAEFLALGSYFLSRDFSRGFAGDALKQLKALRIGEIRVSPVNRSRRAGWASDKPTGDDFVSSF
ncbi:unnamed protein product [Urochloa humidicola]